MNSVIINDNFRDNIYELASTKIGGSKRFLQWVETRQLFRLIKSYCKEKSIMGIECPDIRLNLNHSTIVEKAEDLPLELLFEFLKQYIMQEGWNDIDEGGNSKERSTDYETRSEGDQNNIYSV